MGWWRKIDAFGNNPQGQSGHALGRDETEIEAVRAGIESCPSLKEKNEFY